MNFIPKITYIELNTGTPKTITFETPPEGDPFNEEDQFKERSTRSTAGVRQTQFNYNLSKQEHEFKFQSESVKDAVQDWARNHAGRGGEFNYFPSEDEVEFEVFNLVGRALKYLRPIPNGALDFFYNFGFSIERVTS